MLPRISREFQDVSGDSWGETVSFKGFQGHSREVSGGPMVPVHYE